MFLHLFSVLDAKQMKKHRKTKKENLLPITGVPLILLIYYLTVLLKTKKQKNKT
jgi:hypothetical protein